MEKKQNWYAKMHQSAQFRNVKNQITPTLWRSTPLFSERELKFTFAIIYCRPSVVCLSSVMFVRPTQAIEIFGNISTPWAIHDLCIKIYGDRPRGTPSSGELNTRGVVEYSNFGHIQRYISETVQDESYYY